MSERLAMHVREIDTDSSADLPDRRTAYWMMIDTPESGEQK
jgi:hypothetical protein